MSSDRARKELVLGENHKNKLETYAERQNMNHSEAARRLIDQGIEHEQQPGLINQVVKESFELSIFLTLVLSIFTVINPLMLYFAITSLMFSVGLGLGIVYQTADVDFPWVPWSSGDKV